MYGVPPLLHGQPQNIYVAKGVISWENIPSAVTFSHTPMRAHVTVLISVPWLRKRLRSGHFKNHPLCGSLYNRLAKHDGGQSCPFYVTAALSFVVLIDFGCLPVPLNTSWSGSYRNVQNGSCSLRRGKGGTFLLLRSCQIFVNLSSITWLSVLKDGDRLQYICQTVSTGTYGLCPSCSAEPSTHVPCSPGGF